MVDPAQVQATLAELQKQENARRHVDPALAANLVMDKLKVERFYNQLEPNPSSLGSDPPRGLIEAGLGALLDILAGL